jgi:hypothetical protein
MGKALNWSGHETHSPFFFFLFLCFVEAKAIYTTTRVPTRTSPAMEKSADGGGRGMPEMEMRCLVVGAGISGLAAAQMLRKNGFQVKILEANSRIGGRICPMDLTANLLPSEEAQEYQPITVQCGANWVHDLRSSNPIYRLVEKEQLTLFDTHDGDHLFGQRSYISDRSHYEAHSTPRIFTPEELSRVNLIGTKMERHYGIIRKRLRKLKAAQQHQVTLSETIDRAIRRIYSEELSQTEGGAGEVVHDPSIQQLLYLHYAFMGFSEGYELNNVSFTRWFDVADEDFEFGEAIICEGTSRLLGPLSESLDIQLNTPISCVDWQELHSSISSPTPTAVQPLIHLHTLSGETYSAPHVIITSSVGVLQSGSLSFNPPLPSGHQTSLSKIQMAKMNVVVLRFKKQFWPKNYLLFAATPPKLAYMEPISGDPTPQHNLPVSQRNDIFSHFYNLTLMRSPQNQEGSEEEREGDNGDQVPPLLFGEIYGDHCDLIKNCTFEELASSAFNTLQMIFGSDIAEHPIGCVTKLWNKDPLTYGSWCNYCLGVSPQDVIQLGQPICSCCPSPDQSPTNPLLNAIKKARAASSVFPHSSACSLQISGEGTSPVQVGTLQGAHDTGVRSAKHIIQFHKPSIL